MVRPAGLLDPTTRRRPFLDPRASPSSPPWRPDRHGLLAGGAEAVRLTAGGIHDAPSSEGSSPAQMLFGIRFQRAWIQVPPSLTVLSFPFLCSALTARWGRQGVVVRADYNFGGGRLFVDDGSCVTELMLRPEDA
ncbi:Fatty acyl-CoA reductase [Hordeum vulgare]|nr:Fatty acyl-CoA reductase [Hordeum vulgare]